MRTPSRRELLSGATGVLALAAGCIAKDDSVASTSSSGSRSSSNEGETAERTTDDHAASSELDESESPTDEPANPSTDAHRFQYAETASRPDAALFGECEAAIAWLEDRDVGDESATEFVRETAFENSVLVILEAGAPNLCSGLVLDSAAVEDDALELEAAVRDESEDGMVCAPQETTVGTLVRVSDGRGAVTDVLATIVDREGSEHEFALATKSERKARAAAE